MDWQWIANIGGGLSIMFLGALSKIMWKIITDLQKATKQLLDELNTTKLYAANNYVKRTDCSAAHNRVHESLDRIELKLDSKADKNNG